METIPENIFERSSGKKNVLLGKGAWIKGLEVDFGKDFARGFGKIIEIIWGKYLDFRKTWKIVFETKSPGKSFLENSLGELFGKYMNWKI